MTLRLPQLALYLGLGLMATLSSTRAAQAAIFASDVISYAPGSAAPAFRNPASALGSPDAITGEGYGFPTALNPFSPAFEPDELVQVGSGGHITLRFPNYVNIGGPGLHIGVIENVGLIDNDYPNGTAGSPASMFGADSAIVEVSLGGANWVPLNGGNPILFDMPAMYYRDPLPNDIGAPLADFGKPFAPAGGAAAFSGLTYSQIKALYAGSGGGKWLDLSSTGLTQIDSIRFTAAPGGTFDLDAVVIANSAVGDAVPVPEPASWLLASLGLALLLLDRRRLGTPFSPGTPGEKGRG